MPQWLTDYRPGLSVSFDEFMSGRVGYYPGSYDDGNLVKVGNIAHCVHSYLYVDYLMRKSDILKSIDRDGFKGYHPLGSVEWTASDFTNDGKFPLDRTKAINKEEEPYCFMTVFERDSDKDDDWGAERFAFAFLFSDGIETYRKVFCDKYHKAPYLILIQDHGFGGNYDRFGRGGLLDQIRTEANVNPDFMLCCFNTPVWDGYRQIPGFSTNGGCTRFQRNLYISEY